MVYQNPFYYLSIDPAQFMEQPEKVLKRKKKELLAEFELSEKKTILLEGVEFDKDTVLGMLEGLTKRQAQLHHKTIFEHADLRKFLENGDLDFFEADPALMKNRKLMQFISEPFTHQYNRSLYQLIKDKNLLLIKHLVASPLPFKPKGIAACYKDSYRHLIYMLQEANGLERKKRVAEAHTEVLLILPSYFDTVRKMYRPYLREPDLFSPETAKKIRKYLIAGVVGIGLVFLWLFFGA